MEKKNRQNIGLLWVLPSLAGVGAFYLIPSVQSFFYAFTQGTAHPRFAGLLNFRELFGNEYFVQAVQNTARFLAAAVFGGLFFALVIGLASARVSSPAQRWSFLLPMLIPPTSMAVFWAGLWGENGAFNALRQRLGMGAADYLYGEKAFWVAAGLFLLKNVGVLSLILASAIESLPKEYWENFCLESDRAEKYFARVLFPLLTQELLTCIVVGVMNYFLFFRDLYALYGNDPPQQLYMLQHFMNANFFKLNYQRLSAAAFSTITAGLLIAAALLLAKKRWAHEK